MKGISLQAPPVRILLVEDNPGDAELVAEALHETRVPVKLARAERLEQALAHLRCEATDAVLLDLQLPDATGIEAIESLSRAFPKLPIVVLTGAASAVGLEALQSGAQDFLSKHGIDGPAIERAIRYSIERQRHQERAQELAAERAARRAAEAAARLLELSYRVAEAGLTRTDPKECLRAVVGEVRAGLQTDTATLLLMSSDGRDLVVEASEGLGELDGERVPVGQGIAGMIAASGRSRVIPDVSRESIVSPALHQLASLMGAPLRIGERIIGVLHVGSFHPRDFTDEEVRILDTVGSRIALVVENGRLHERARLQEERWRMVLETMDDMVCIADLDGNIRYVNRALSRWLGTTVLTDSASVAEYARRHLFRPDGSRFAFDELPLSLALRGEPVSSIEVVDRSENGEERIGLWTGSLVRQPDGRARFAILVGHDVTERKRSEETLREADRRKDEFLAMLSHELRNPLAPIRNAIYLLQRLPPGSEGAHRALQIIERQVGHMSRLISDLLDVSRITRGKIRITKERLDLRLVVGRSIEDLRSIFVARGIAVATHLPAEAVWIEADATRFEQLISNLLNNAAKFTNEGGRVTVELRRDGSTAVLRVEDTGVGIAPPLLGRLFEPFAQADRTLDRAAGGLGLGLALVKGLVELHGGSVEAKSAGAGLGAEFVVRLPAESEPPERPERAHGRRSAAPARRILIIEDNEDAAETLKQALELDRHEVTVAYSGPEGLRKARNFCPEVIFCDIGLPGMDGYAVARELRRDPALSSVRLIALTGYAQPEDSERALEAGFDLHLAKPPEVEQIESVLASCL